MQPNNDHDLLLPKRQNSYQQLENRNFKKLPILILHNICPEYKVYCFELHDIYMNLVIPIKTVIILIPKTGQYSI